MKPLAFSRKAVQLLGLGILVALGAQLGKATEVSVIGVRRSSDGSAGLLLKVPDNTELSARDLGAMVDAANRSGAGASSRQVTHSVSGRRFGELAVVSPPVQRVREALPNRKREGVKVAKSKAEVRPKAKVTPSSTPAPAVKPTKPDVIIFEPEERGSVVPGSGATTQPPAAPVPGGSDGKPPGENR